MKSSTACAKAESAASSRPTRWSWASTSARSTPRSWPAIAGTIASTWQRAGRAGRRSGSSCAVLVASSAPLDQFIVQHPDYFFGRSPEHAFVQPDNLEILVNHLKCAAFELPIAADETFGGVDVPELCERLGEAGFLHRTGEHWHWTQEAYPADTVSLRSVTSDNFVIVDTRKRPK